jgi:hypothetical protein
LNGDHIIRILPLDGQQKKTCGGEIKRPLSFERRHDFTTKPGIKFSFLPLEKYARLTIQAARGTVSPFLFRKGVVG